MPLLFDLLKHILEDNGNAPKKYFSFDGYKYRDIKTGRTYSKLPKGGFVVVQPIETKTYLQ